MKCRRARKLTFEFIDGRIDDAKRLDLEKHLAHCADCEKFSSQLARSMDLVHRAPVEIPDENFAWKVRLKINQERKTLQKSALSEGSLIRSWNVRYVAGAVAACAVVVVAGLVAVQSGLGPSGPGERITGQADEVATAGEPDGGRTVEPGTRTTRVGVKAPEIFSFPRNLGGGLPVSVGSGYDRFTNGSPGVIDQSSEPVVLDIDSILNMEIDKLPPEERARYIRERLRLLNEHLERYSIQYPNN